MKTVSTKKTVMVTTVLLISSTETLSSKSKQIKNNQNKWKEKNKTLDI